MLKPFLFTLSLCVAGSSAVEANIRKDPSSLNQEAEMRYTDGDVYGAIELWNSILASTASTDQVNSAYSGLAQAWASKNNLERLWQTIDAWIAYGNAEPEAIFALASQLREQDQLEAALAYARLLPVRQANDYGSLSRYRSLLASLLAEIYDHDHLYDAALSLGASLPDGDAEPFYREAVRYPVAARVHKWNGECVVNYDIDAFGATTNIKADCDYPVFATTTIRTVSRWVYVPKRVNGEPVTRTGVQTTLRYRYRRPS